MARSRRPFDPRRVRVNRDEQLSLSAGDAQPGMVSVAQVNRMVDAALTRSLPAKLSVVGELSDVSRPQSGHVYFTLKDTHSELRGVMWRSDAVRLKFDLHPGLEVIAHGAVEVYLPRGTYQLMTRRLEPRGVGSLELAFRQLQEKLASEGLFDPRRKRRLSPVPQCIGVVTSPRGAAIRDILQTLRRRYPAARVLVFPVAVQGDGAALEIARAVRVMSDHRDALGVDVLIVGRGGGSAEDLWAFNEEAVARAIADCAVPVISAVGHETDISIADLVADVRAATPTAAAELVAPRAADLLARVREQLSRTASMVRHTLNVGRTDLRRLAASELLARPERLLNTHRQRTDERLQRLRQALRERLQRAERRVERAAFGAVRFASSKRFARIAEQVTKQQYRLQRATERRLAAERRRLDRARGHVERLSPLQRLSGLRRDVDVQAQRGARGARNLVALHRRLLAARLEAVRACDPQSVLRRGYAVARDGKSRRVLRTVDAIRDKQRVIIELSDGEFRATADDPRQGSLFDDQ